MTLPRVVLWFSAVLFLPFGLWGLVDPVQVTGLTQVQLPTPTALADGRAMYGGMVLGLGLVFAFCASRPSMLRAGLWALLLTIGCVFLGRLAGVLIDGASGTPTLPTLALEFALSALAGFALWREPEST